MVVVTIIGILVLIAYVSYGSAVSRAQAATCASNRRTLNGAIETCLISTGEYPTSITDLKPYIENWDSARRCPRQVNLIYDASEHKVVCPIHGD